MMIGDLIPAGFRKAVYIILGTATALELIWDVVPDVLEGKLLASLSALGFGLAAAHTPNQET